MEYVEQIPENLRFFLLNGTINEEPLQILQSQNLILTNFKIQAHIIGMSHYLKIFCNNLELNEVLACVDNVEGQIIDNRSLQSNFYNEYVFGDLHYTMEAFTAPLESSYFLEELETARAEIPDCFKSLHMEQSFPAENENSPVALTLVKIIETNAYNIKISTIHTYPNVGKAAFSISQLHLNPCS